MLYLIKTLNKILLDTHSYIQILISTYKITYKEVSLLDLLQTLNNLILLLMIIYYTPAEINQSHLANKEDQSSAGSTKAQI